MLEAWEADGFEAAKNAFDAEVEVVDLQSAMGMRDRARGPDELLRLAQHSGRSDLRRLGMDVCDLVDLGGEWVLADVSFRGVGRDASCQQPAVRGLPAGRRPDR